MKEKPIIIFDGVCNLCNSAVDFVLKRDQKKVFIFLPNQVMAGKKILEKYGIKDLEVKSVYLIEEKKIYSQSNAIFRILKRLSFPWNLGYVLMVIPRPIRDFIYNIIAKNRYQWFGKRDVCRVLSDEEKARFLL